MPYKIVTEGSKHCVHKKLPDGGTGRKLGCHPSKEAAQRQIRAIYASENKEIGMTDEIEVRDIDNQDQIHDTDVEKAKSTNNEKMLHWSSAKDFDEYEAEKEAQEAAQEINETAQAVSMFAENIIYSDEQDKPGKLSKMLDQAKARFSSLFGMNKEKENEKEPDVAVSKEDGTSLLITKNANGRYVWLARYSNNARDIDNPPEIISAKSHKRFVEMVDKGLYPMPELWIWHVKEWKLGTASVVDFDEETGFAVAAGLIDEDKHELAKSISLIDPSKLRMSHGMPYGSIVRDQEDPTTIIEHQTKEISVLPAWAAANPLTGFIMNAQKEKEMIDPKKSQEMEKLGVLPDQLGQVEAANQADKALVEENGIETKEKAEEEITPEVETTAEEAPEVTEPAPETVETEEVKETPITLTVQDIADVMKAAVEPLVKQNQELAERIEGLESRVKELSASDDEKFEKEVSLTPRESLFASVIGNPLAKVDGRTKEGKDGPKETPVEKEMNSVGIPFLGNLDNWRDNFKEISQ